MFWRGFLTGLKLRELSEVQLVISDQHAGLLAALTRCIKAPRTSIAGCTSPATRSSPTGPLSPRAAAQRPTGG
ncbi:MAG: transposase [Micromonosporaceae bacterium]|nr:transposase [Micromonosporaceae bacterium]